MNQPTWVHRLGPILLVVGGGALAVQALMAGDAPLLAWLGLALILTGGVQGAPRWLAISALLLAPIRFTSFVLPVAKYGLGQPWPVALTSWLGFTAWEALPLLAGGLAILLGARSRKVPAWAVFLLAAGLTTGASVWIPRPYALSYGATLVEPFPELVWLMGADLAAGLAMGTLAIVALVVHRPVTHRESILATVPLTVAVIAGLGYRSYASDAELAPKEPHRVMAIQGGLAPFSGGFAVQSKRALYPMMAFSTLQPDLLIFPENFIQAAPGPDPDDAAAVEQRHFHSVGMGIAVPYSQVLFGVRDFETSRTYYTDLFEGKPHVVWRDLQGRVPFVDVWPKALQGVMEKVGRIASKPLRRPEKDGCMGLYAKDTTKENGLKPIGRALILQSGEIRAPRLIGSLRANSDATVVINPTIAGWMGPSESRASLIQANARMMELGLVGYRVGQLSGTEFFVPWREVRDEVKSLGSGNLTFTARVPKARLETGYTAFCWLLALYVAPLSAVACLGWLTWTALAARRAARVADPSLLPIPAAS